ncbi:MAG: ATPase [Duncaniella sp.]|nr:ATPase [Duncaniella sp.]
MNKKLIVDSGGNKISWGGALNAVTRGFNAVDSGGETLCDILAEISGTREDITEIRFFGAGITDDTRREEVKFQLKRFFTKAEIFVESDLVGAAVALCGDNSGVAAILGTGANSCQWDGQKIVANTPALGYIIGDEGSGAVIGKHFLESYLKHRFSREIEARVFIDPKEVIENVYREGNPRKYLSSFAPLIRELAGEFEEVNRFALEELKKFFTFNIDPYGVLRGTKVNFTGSIAYHFKDILAKAAEETGYTLGKVIKDPMENLIKFYGA